MTDYIFPAADQPIIAALARAAVKERADT
jgi:hypothetical protein